MARCAILDRHPQSGQRFPLAKEFNNRVGGLSALLNEISFLGIVGLPPEIFRPDFYRDHQAVAMRLRDTFRKYSLSAHPSYFAGNPTHHQRNAPNPGK